MTKNDRVRYNMFIRAVQFIQDNIADFTAGGVVATQLALLIAIVGRIETMDSKQSEGMSGAEFEYYGKETARENLMAILRMIARTARSMVYEFPGINLKFRVPENDSDSNILAAGRAFHTEATPIEADFKRYEADKDFLIDLQTAIDDFDESLSKPGAEIDQHVAATAETGAEVRKGMIAVRTLNGPVKNKYADNIGKLTAWKSASHVEKVPVERPRTNKDGKKEE